MIIRMIERATRILGKEQGYLALPIRDEIIDGVKVMVSAWEPTPDELRRLNEGATVKLMLHGVVHPPVRVEVEQ